VNLDRLYYLGSNGFYPNSILDIGACAGDISLQLKEIWPKSQLLLLEANPLWDSSLKKTGLIYKICLLGKENKDEVNFYTTKRFLKSTGNSIYKENSEDFNDENLMTLKLPMYKLDDFLRSENYDLIKMKVDGVDVNVVKLIDEPINLPQFKNQTFDLIKIDTQGSEIDILMGGIETFRKAKYIMMETSVIKFNEGGQMIGEAFKFMNENGFRMVDIIDLSYKEQDLAQVDLLFKHE
jgi:FkbM family methyltransferase